MLVRNIDGEFYAYSTTIGDTPVSVHFSVEEAVVGDNVDDWRSNITGIYRFKQVPDDDDWDWEEYDCNMKGMVQDIGAKKYQRVEAQIEAWVSDNKKKIRR